MSHAVSIATAIKDLGALEKACESLGAKLIQTEKPHQSIVDGFRVRGLNVPIPSITHEIILPNTPVRIGVYKDNENDAYALVVREFYVKGTVAGPGAGKLLQAYGVEKTVIEATKRGYRVARECGAQGTVRVILTKEQAARN